VWLCSLLLLAQNTPVTQDLSQSGIFDLDFTPVVHVDLSFYLFWYQVNKMIAIFCTLLAEELAGLPIQALLNGLKDFSSSFEFVEQTSYPFPFLNGKTLLEG
jgi:hypothetical protein